MMLFPKDGSTNEARACFRQYRLNLHQARTERARERYYFRKNEKMMLFPRDGSTNEARTCFRQYGLNLAPGELPQHTE